MKNITKKFLFVLLVVFALYNVLVWVIPFPKKDFTSFLINYIASIVMFIAQPIIYKIAMKNDNSLKSVLYGLPILKVGYLYAIIQSIITILSYIVGAFIAIPLWISIVLSVLVIAFVLIGVLLTDTYRDEIEKIEVSAPTTKKFVTELRNESSSLANKINQEPIHTKLVEFKELVRYSDPVSVEELVDFEEEITQKFDEMKKLAVSDKILEATKMLEEITNMMNDRNNRCKSYKK